MSLFKDCSKEWMQYCTLKQKNLQWRAISSFFIFQFYLNFFDEWHGKSIYSPATITNMAICLNCSSRERMFSDNKIINEMDSPVGLRSGAFVLILMFNFSSHIFVSKKSLWKTSRITCSSHSSFLISSVCLSVCLSAFLFLSLSNCLMYWLGLSTPSIYLSIEWFWFFSWQRQTGQQQQQPFFFFSRLTRTPSHTLTNLPLSSFNSPIAYEKTHTSTIV